MIREFTIKPVLNGYIAQCGCQILVFESQVSLLNAITKYLEDPSKTEREFMANSVNSEWCGAGTDRERSLTETIPAGDDHITGTRRWENMPPPQPPSRLDTGAGEARI